MFPIKEPKHKANGQSYGQTKYNYTTINLSRYVKQVYF